MNERHYRGEHLKLMRTRHKVTQKEAAIRCGVPLVTWKCWEQDRRRITKLQLDEIARKLVA